MRLWLKDSERRPDPEQLQTDDRKAVLVGIALWLAALAALLVFIGPLLAAGNGGWLWTCVAGLGLGLIGLLFAHSRRRGSRADASESPAADTAPADGSAGAE